MAKHTQEQQEYHIARIRAVLVLAPDAGSRQIQKTLETSEKSPIRLDRAYIDKLKGKIIRRRTAAINRENINARLAKIRDRKAVVDEMLWREATNPSNQGRDRVAALKELMKNELDMLQAEMDAGVFERKLGTLAHIPAPINDDQRAAVMKALLAHGIVRAPVEVKAIEKPKQNEKSKNTTNRTPRRRGTR